MLERLRESLVTSFVGAIALGWIFAQGIWHFANVFSAPIYEWLMRREYHGRMELAPSGSPLQNAVPELVKSVSLLLVGYLLLRWLYFKQLKQEIMKSESEQSPSS